jgi:hypothetical protein
VNEDFVNNFAAYEKNGEGAVVMTNSANGGPIANEILHSVAAVYRWPEFQPTVRTVVSAESENPGSIRWSLRARTHLQHDHHSRQRPTDFQATRQRKFPLFAESETMFFSKDVNAEIEFPKDEKGPGSELILHQNGRECGSTMSKQKRLRMSRLHLTRGSPIKPRRRGSEAAMRRMIGELQTGKPNYDLMNPGLAEVTRQQLPQLQSMIVAMGALQSVIFEGIGPGGA